MRHSRLLNKFLPIPSIYINSTGLISTGIYIPGADFLFYKNTLYYADLQRYSSVPKV